MWSSTSLQAWLEWCFDDTSLAGVSEGSMLLHHVSSLLMVETLAMKKAVLKTKRNSIFKVWFRTYFLKLARVVKSKIYSVGFLEFSCISSYFLFRLIFFSLLLTESIMY